MKGRNMLHPLKRIVGDVVIITTISVGYCVSLFTMNVVGEKLRDFSLKNS